MDKEYEGNITSNLSTTFWRQQDDNWSRAFSTAFLNLCIDNVENVGNFTSPLGSNASVMGL